MTLTFPAQSGKLSPDLLPDFSRGYWHIVWILFSAKDCEFDIPSKMHAVSLVSCNELVSRRMFAVARSYCYDIEVLALSRWRSETLAELLSSCLLSFRVPAENTGTARVSIIKLYFRLDAHVNFHQVFPGLLSKTWSLVSSASVFISTSTYTMISIHIVLCTCGGWV